MSGQRNRRDMAASDANALMVILEGLVPLHIARLTRPGELARAHAKANTEGGLADLISEAGDRLTASGNFRASGEHRTRAQVLTAMATCLALGAHQPGGITWAAAHWCTAPHPACPHAPNGAV